MPSIWPEPFGRIPVEANRLGVPAVVTNRGALPEIVKDGTTGIITEADSDSLANAIARAISREWDRNTIMRRSFELINPTSIIDELIKFFERILG
jgi:glycosyltransferase involved in cell wall biosynthesis